MLCLPNELLDLVGQFLDDASMFSLGCTAKSYQKIFCHKYRYIIRDAIFNKYFNLFRWLVPDVYCLANDRRYKLRIMAAESNCIKILKYLFGKHSITGMTIVAITPILEAAAAKGNSVDVIQWIHDHQRMGDGYSGYSISLIAAKHGNLAVLQWLKEHEYRWNRWTCTTAAENGQLDVLKYLHEHQMSLYPMASYFAALNGHLDVVKYLHENGCGWSGYNCYAAAKGGHLDVLQYLHENGCNWDNETRNFAINNGHLDVVKYLDENGCP